MVRMRRRKYTREILIPFRKNEQDSMTECEKEREKERLPPYGETLEFLVWIMNDVVFFMEREWEVEKLVWKKRWLNFGCVDFEISVVWDVCRHLKKLTQLKRGEGWKQRSWRWRHLGPVEAWMLDEVVWGPRGDEWDLGNRFCVYIYATFEHLLAYYKYIGK